MFVLTDLRLPVVRQLELFKEHESMANHPSALKAHRQSLRRRSRNRSNRSALRTALKNFSEQMPNTPPEKSGATVAELYSLVDKAARRKSLSKNAAARQKSRLTKRLNQALQAKAGK
jgi:small subunit ribosomal protein S20